MGSRRKAREYAVQLLYLLDLRSDEPPEPLIETFWAGESWDPVDKAFTMQLVTGTRAHLASIDAMIAAHASNWKIARMPVVDRNILRLGVYELCEDPALPASVVINEAIELTKRFSSAEARAFVNGVLNQVKCDCREETDHAR